MLGIVQYLIGFVGLGLMVFVHELGHFVAARLNGVAVEVFSLGWGPKLLGFTLGEGPATRSPGSSSAGTAR